MSTQTRTRDQIFYNTSGDPIPVEDWAKLYQDGRTRSLDFKVLTVQTQPVVVVTNWLGVNAGLADPTQERPMIFSTEVIGGEYHGMIRLWASQREAQDGHREVLRQVSTQ